ncbi:hypothetical protein D9619_008426 [Psilocybe cf. subviscida]|uniref:NACHT domain-containing protein n=1 Tax=Psilocybe cf. subviscida TaxID=2480587 RepID=A0A8H5B9Z4_9AGAR|nr:hypothetical protein D9619_008426 [Psilocybe cf. subviscida]
MVRSTTLNHNQSNKQMINGAAYQLAASDAGQASAFTNANNVSIKDSSFTITSNINVTTKPALDLLYQRVAPNAILNQGGRADDPKCHPGTREEVIALIEKWMDNTGGNCILWLSGPAGGGKTAIMKTIAERSTTRGIHTVNFFFFRGDSSRKSARPVVPTLLYQLMQLYPHLTETVAAIFATHPRILDTSITEQCRLISTLATTIRQSSLTGTPIVLLIDALDECDVDAERSQGDILRALQRLVFEDNSPFRLLIASRPEQPYKPLLCSNLR